MYKQVRQTDPEDPKKIINRLVWRTDPYKPKEPTTDADRAALDAAAAKRKRKGWM